MLVSLETEEIEENHSSINFIYGGKFGDSVEKGLESFFQKWGTCKHCIEILFHTEYVCIYLWVRCMCIGMYVNFHYFSHVSEY